MVDSRQSRVAPELPARELGVADRLAEVSDVEVPVVALLVIAAAIGLARTPLPVPDDRGYTVLTIGPTAGDPASVTIAERIALPAVNTGAVTALLLDDSSGVPIVYRRVRIDLPLLGPAPVAPPTASR